MMDGDRKEEGKSGKGGLLPSLHQNSKQQATQIGLGIGGFGTNEGDGAGEHFRVSSSPQMHLNAGWFHACRHRQARTQFHQLTVSIRAPLSFPGSVFFSTLLAIAESQHAAPHLLHTFFFSFSLFLQSFFLIARMLSQHVLAGHIEILTWRNSSGCGHCYLGGNTSGFAFSSEFPFTEIMGLNDLLPKTLILSSH